MFKLNNQSNSFVQDLLLSLSYHSESLVEYLLSNLLAEGHTITNSFQAELVGKLCSFRNPASVQGKISVWGFSKVLKNFLGLKNLQSLFFKQLEQQAPKITNTLMPILNGLTFAISQQVSDLEFSVEFSQINLLVNAITNTLDGSLLRDSLLRLLSAFVQNNANIYKQLLQEVSIGTGIFLSFSYFFLIFFFS